jgi:tryptophan halogenase
LDALQLHVAHIGISHLVNFWPVGTDMALEAGEYNRLFRLHASNLRDFQAAHYKLNGRHGEPFWDRVRNAEAPESLERKLNVFGARADCPLYDEETFEANSWAALFLGHGLIPQSHDPRVDLIPEQEHIGQVQDRLRQIAAMVPTLPTVDSFLSATLIPVEVPPRT